MKTAFEHNMKNHIVKTGLALTALAATGMLLSAHATTAPGNPVSGVATPPSVLVFDQKVSGTDVSVDYANLQRGGHLVIYPSNSAGQPAKDALGHTPLKSGDHRNIKVKLTTPPKPGDVLWASLYVDTDGQPSFDKTKDGSVWPEAIPTTNRFIVK